MAPCPFSFKLNVAVATQDLNNGPELRTTAIIQGIILALHFAQPLSFIIQGDSRTSRYPTALPARRADNFYAAMSARHHGYGNAAQQEAPQTA